MVRFLGKTYPASARGEQRLQVGRKVIRNSNETTSPLRQYVEGFSKRPIALPLISKALFYTM
jgi:hypothetical protein